ncbi:hypothetical protein LFWB_5500 [Candidatus Phytoplasma luffae]|uniref:Uncharacterized protein n=2 Tax=Loofah witches'-broom phytoplasma TaxID=35773 RepID=A0A975FJS8_LOWBP|nr:hypothetical protein LFWB_5050 [Candidatus Phytoplasma luffae]QTX03116.1 hypothetical protein LFWB_5500 [Candidatus Phytoplasma luffae]
MICCPSISAHPYFHHQSKSKIKLSDYQTLQQEWLATQPKMKRYDIPVLSKESIPDILKYFNIKASIYFLQEPSYNPYDYTFFDAKLKNPPSGLIGAYFKPRHNPFNIKYPDEDDEFTLEELLDYGIAIKEAFVFWDTKQKPQEENVNIELIIIEMFADQNKEEAINNYLIKNNIIKEPKLIKLGCYNATPHTGLVLPLPFGKFLFEFEIDAIYFDDGIRLLSENRNIQSLRNRLEWKQEFLQEVIIKQNSCEDTHFKTVYQESINEINESINQIKEDIIKSQSYTIEDLTKLSNGAKNIYLFFLNVQKRKKIIELPDSLDPYQTIRDWKRENNLYTFPPLIKESEYKEETEKRNWDIEITSPSYKKIDIPFQIKKIFQCLETDDCIYFVVCNDTLQIKLAEQYRNAYINWLKQCYIQYGCSYSAQEIRNKFGKTSRIIYDENGNTCWYQYVPGFFSDDWIVNGHNCVGNSNIFYNFYNTTPPPKRIELSFK